MKTRKERKREYKRESTEKTIVIKSKKDKYDKVHYIGTKMIFVPTEENPTKEILAEYRDKLNPNEIEIVEVR